MKHVVSALIAAPILLFAASCSTSSSGPVMTTGAIPVDGLRARELSSLLIGNTVTLDDNAGYAYLSYRPNGRYVHFDSKGQSVGTYRITGGQVCVTFVSGHKRCDAYVRTGGETPSYYFKNGSGMLYPVVAVQPISAAGAIRGE